VRFLSVELPDSRFAIKGQSQAPRLAWKLLDSFPSARGAGSAFYSQIQEN
jgi:hypothetical protein